MTRPSSPARAVTPPRRRRYLWRLVRANFYDFWLLVRESWLVLVAFALLAAGASIYLTFFYPATAGSPRPADLPESLYETLKLMTLQSGLAFPANDLVGGILFFLTPLLGLALIFQSVLNFGRLLLDKGSRREAWQVSLASAYQNHVIVCGLGRLGLRVVTQLIAAGHEPVVVERDWNSEFVARVLHLRVPVVLGDAREPTVLRQAGVMRARAVVMAINDDMLNVEVALTARALRPDIRVVLRVFNEELDQNLERSLGVNSAFSASALAAPTYAAAAVSRDIDYALMLGNIPLGVGQLTMPAEMSSADLRQLSSSHTPLHVLSHVARDGRHCDPHSQIRAGDQVTLLGRLDDLEAARRRITTLTAGQGATNAPVAEQSKTVIVCGLGKVGYRVVNQLYRLTPRPRIVVVRMGDGRAEFPQHISQLDGVTTVIGDARDIGVLRQAGLDNAYSIAAVTSDDLLNVQIALNARRQRPDVQIVLRTFSDTLAEKLAEMFGIHTTYSTSALAGPTLAAAALAAEVQHAFFADSRVFAVRQLHLDAEHPYTPLTVAAIRERYDTLVLDVRRDDQTLLLPESGFSLQAGDQMTLLAPIDALLTLARAARSR